jgi:WD40 repeat protein
VECRRTISDHRTGVTSLSYHDGNIYSGAYDGSIKVFNAESGQMVRNLHGHQLSVWALGVSDDGRRLFSAGSDGTINAWDISSTGEEAEFVEHTNKDHGGKVYSLVVLGDRLISASSDRTIRIWDYNLTCLATLQGHEDVVNSLCLFKDGQIASASSDKTLRIWDLSRAQSLKTVSCPSEALSVCYSPNDKMLFSSHYDATITAFDAVDCRRLETMVGHSWEVWQLQHTNEGHCLFSGSFDHNIKRWDTRMFECTATLRGHRAFVHALTLGNSNLISGCADKTIKVIFKGIEGLTLQIWR